MISLNSTLGKFKSTGEEIVEASLGVIDMLMIFENTEMVFRVQFDKEEKVKGFQFLPISMQPKFSKKDPKDYENDISIKTKFGEIFGEINYPDGEGPFPGILFISGSGPNDRDGNSAVGVKSDYILKITKVLNEHGFAVLRFDKRGSGHSIFKFDQTKLIFQVMIDDTAS